MSVRKRAEELVAGDTLIVWTGERNEAHHVDLVAPVKDARGRATIHVKAGDRTFSYRPTSVVYVQD